MNFKKNPHTKNPTTNTNKGFSLLEVLVSIGILGTVFLGVFTLSNFVLTSSRTSRNQTTAFFLASEAVEYIRNIRDTNRLNGIDWLSGMDDCQLSSGCIVDVPQNTIVACGSECPPIKFNPDSNLYSYASGQDSIFTRKISITPTAGADYEVQISVDISWKDRVLSRSITLEENLFENF